MTFYDEMTRLSDTNFASFFDAPAPSGAANALASATDGQIQPHDFLALLSPRAAGSLEEMAQIAHRLTLQNFGPNILLFTPLYLGNYCVNYCVYCGFNASHNIERRRLTLAEVELEGRVIAESGLADPLP